VRPAPPGGRHGPEVPAPLLRVRGLRVRFRGEDGPVEAVRGVDLDVGPGERVGIVGESGSGKSALALALLGLLPRSAEVAAEALEFEGRDLLGLGAEERRRLRGDRMAMVFQDPMTSLNPYLTIGDQVGEPLVVHRGLGLRAARARAVELLAGVGIPDPAARAAAYPHEFSGGMRQRAMVAMAIACRPALLIADEPTTALDVTVQAQVLDLLLEIGRSSGTAIVLITHDLGVVARFCQRVLVCYAGRIVERAPAGDLFRAPAHPYARALLRSAPRPDVPVPGEGPRRLPAIPGRPPDLFAPPPGCAFAPRCGLAMDRCRSDDPRLEPVPGAPGRERACWAPFPLGEEAVR
jgi:oligopeptide/dipeptide ABC transporter ATP-binding protein